MAPKIVRLAYPLGLPLCLTTTSPSSHARTVSKLTCPASAAATSEAFGANAWSRASMEVNSRCLQSLSHKANCTMTPSIGGVRFAMNSAWNSFLDASLSHSLDEWLCGAKVMILVVLAWWCISLPVHGENGMGGRPKIGLLLASMHLRRDTQHSVTRKKLWICFTGQCARGWVQSVMSSTYTMGNATSCQSLVLPWSNSQSRAGVLG